MDVYSLLSVVKSRYHPDNYDLHKKLQIASKKYYEFTKDLNIDEYFDTVIEKSDNKITYHVCKVKHRLRGPALTMYHDNGYRYEEYYNNGKLHREDGLHKSKPVVILYNKDGSKKYKFYSVTA